MNDPHAASAAAKGRFDDERETDFMGDLQGGGAVGHRFFRAGQSAHVDFPGQGAGGDFVAHQLDYFRARADEGDARRGASAGKLGILGQESVTGMNEINLLSPWPAR